MTDADRIHLQLQSFGTFYAQFVQEIDAFDPELHAHATSRTSSLEEDDVMHKLFFIFLSHGSCPHEPQPQPHWSRYHLNRHILYFPEFHDHFIHRLHLKFSRQQLQVYFFLFVLNS